jgi:hypothetical protein
MQFFKACVSIDRELRSSEINFGINNTIQVLYVLLELGCAACSGKALNTINLFLHRFTHGRPPPFDGQKQYGLIV